MTAQENTLLLNLLAKKQEELGIGIDCFSDIADEDLYAAEQESRLKLAARFLEKATKLLKEEAQPILDFLTAEEFINTAHTTSVDAVSITFKDEEIIGKKLHNHDSWNGSSMTITIESFEIEGKSIRFIGTNAWGGKSGIYIGGNQLVDLLKTGHAEIKRELEGCTSKETWDLKDA